MYKTNYLSILLILLAFFVFYNEFNKKLSIAEMALLAIAFIAIVRASYNYIQIDNSLKNTEGFMNKHKKNKNKNKNVNDNYDITINSEDSNDYLDVEVDNSNILNNDIDYNKYIDKNKIDDFNNTEIINTEAVNTIDKLLGIGINQKEMFSNTNTEKDDIKSVFSPKIIIGKDNNSNNNNDNNNHSHSHTGFGNREHRSRWNSVFDGKEFDIIQGNECDNDSTDSNCVIPNFTMPTNKKECDDYDSKRNDDDGNLVVQNYKHAKTWFPGYTYLPPSNWDVPQKRAPVCRSPSPNTLKLTGLVDRGLPINVLELNPYGKIANTEDSVELTNVGSILPKFSYEEQPFSKPYV